MPEEKKRPAGLAASKRAKRPKADPQEASLSNATGPDSDEVTVALPAGLAEDDEQGQLVALYQTAVAAGSNRGPSLLGVSSDAWLPLLRGTIHEADRLLRNVTTTPWTDAFFASYAAALLDFSETVEDTAAKEGETAADYRLAAQKLVERGQLEGDGQDALALRLTAARIAATEASQTRQDEESSTTRLLEQMDKILSAFGDGQELSDASRWAALGFHDLQARMQRLVEEGLDSVIEENESGADDDQQYSAALLKHCQHLLSLYAHFDKASKGPDLDVLMGRAAMYNVEREIAEQFPTLDAQPKSVDAVKETLQAALALAKEMPELEELQMAIDEDLQALEGAEEDEEGL